MDIFNNTLYLYPIIIMLMSLSTVIILFYVGNKNSHKNNKYVLNYTLYVVSALSVVFSLVLFKSSSSSIRRDIVFSMQNTSNYNGFVPALILIFIVFLGGLLGYIWSRIEKYVKNNKFK